MSVWTPFWDRVREEERKIVIEWLKTHVSTWTENTINEGFTPEIEDFLELYPEYREPDLYPIIAKEVMRIESIVLRDRKEMA